MNKRYVIVSTALVFISSLVEAKNCANNRICPEPQSCISVKTRLDQIQSELTSCCNSLIFRCNFIREKLANCVPAIKIDQDFMDTATANPITVSGVYCLTETVTGQLTIDADNVVINLNDFSITASGGACISSTGHSNISIIGGGSLQSGAPAGLALTTCANVVVDGVRFDANDNGLFFNGVNSFVIKDSTFNDSFGTAAATFLSTQNGFMRCCLVSNPTARGIEADSCTNLNFEDVKVAQAGDQAWVVVSGNNCSFVRCSGNNSSRGWDLFTNSNDCFCLMCEANQNQNGGFLIVDNQKLIMNSCRALNNTTYGINIDAMDSCVVKCVAKENTTDGFVVTGTQNYLNGNIAIANTTNGYSVAGTDTVLLSNYAEANGTNYTGITDPIVTYTISNGLFSPIAFPSIWQNIDAQP